MHIDDTIGCLLETQEGFDRTKAALVKRLLLNLGKHGPSNLNAEDKAIGMVLMTRYGMKMKDVSDLYGKYIGNWGG